VPVGVMGLGKEGPGPVRNDSRWSEHLGYRTTIPEIRGKFLQYEVPALGGSAGSSRSGSLGDLTGGLPTAGFGTLGPAPGIGEVGLSVAGLRGSPNIGEGADRWLCAAAVDGLLAAGGAVVAAWTGSEFASGFAARRVLWRPALR
jgi:hypothetical protein